MKMTEKSFMDPISLFIYYVFLAKKKNLIISSMTRVLGDNGESLGPFSYFLGNGDS